MKVKKIMLICIFLLAILAVGMASAADSSDVLANETGDVSVFPLDDVEVAKFTNQNELAEADDCSIRVDELSTDEISAVSVSDMPGDASGNIIISIDGKERYNHNVSVGGNALILNDLNLPFDFHNVSIAYSGDGKYAGFVKNATIEPYFQVNAPENSGWNYLEVHTCSNLPGNIKVVIDDKIVFNKKSGSGNVEIDLSKYGIGTHRYEVFYAGKSFKKGKYAISGVDIEYDSNIVYGDSVEFGTYEIKTKGSAKFKNKIYPFILEEDAEGYSYYAHLTISDFDVGENIVEFTFGKKSFNKSVFVSPKLTCPSKLWVNGTYNIVFNASEDCNGELILSGLINGNYMVENGKLKVPISDLSLGEYKLNAKYENYSWNYDIKVLDVTPNVIIEDYYPGTVCIWDWWYNYEDTFNYKIMVFDENYPLAGTTKIYYDGNVAQTIEGDVDFTMPPVWDDLGNHTIFIEYRDDFNSANRTVDFEIVDHECYIGDGSIIIRLPSDAVGNLIAKVDGKTIKTTKVKGNDDFYQYFGIPLDVKKGQIYSIEVAFKGNNYSFTYSCDYEVSCPIRIDAGNYDWGDENTVAIWLPNDIRGKPVVKIDGKTYKTAKVDSGYDVPEYHYEVDISKLGPGRHSINAAYAGDEKYPSNSTNDTINIIARITGPDESSYSYESKFGISLFLPKDAKGDLIAEIRYYDGFEVNCTTSVKNGKATLNLPSDRVGSYDVKAYFNGNCEVAPYSESFIIKPLKSDNIVQYGVDKKIKISMDNYRNSVLVLCIYASGYIPIAEFDLSKSNSILINKAVLNKAKSLMKIKLNQVVKNGYGSAQFGLYPFVYKDGKLLSRVDSITFKFPSKVTGAANINMLYTAGKGYTFKVYDIFGKLVGSGEKVKIQIGKKTFTAKTNRYGVAKFKIPNTITPGKYKVKITYKDLKITNKKLTVKQILSIKTVKVKKSAKKLVLTATLKKVNGKYIRGKWIKFKFKGKTYKAKTSKKGVAKYTIKKSVLKKLKVGKKVTYQATYLKTTVKKTAKVKR